jgi:hypothetical protein
LRNPAFDFGLDPAAAIFTEWCSLRKLPLAFQRLKVTPGVCDAASFVQFAISKKLDVAAGPVFVGEPIECPSPAAAIERAQDIGKVFGRMGMVAFGCTGDSATGDFRNATMLEEFGEYRMI